MDADLTRYDRIGIGYHDFRRPDWRIARMVSHALGDARLIVNVGAGAGSYEPLDRTVVAVEPSVAMIRQRRPGSALVVRATALHLPFDDAVFDAALAVLSVHHWTERRAGLREMRRVASRVAILTWDPAHDGFWLVQEYFPDLLDLDRRIFPSISEFQEALGPVAISPVLIARDCTDGFLGAYWARPEAYLDPGARRAISSFSRIGDVETRIEALRSDLRSGRWAHRHSDVESKDELDVGYRLVVSDG